MEKLHEPQDDFDSMLDAIDKASSNTAVLDEIDDLVGSIDQGFDQAKQEVLNWSEERKRKEATDTTNEFALNLLAFDPNFHVRTLAACNPRMPEASIRRLADTADDYLRVILANNPNTPSDVLDRLTDQTGQEEILNAILRHPNVSQITKFKLERGETRAAVV